MKIKIGIDYDEPIFAWYDHAHDVSVEAGLTTPDAEPPTRWDPHSHYGCTLDEWVAVLDAEVAKGATGMYGRPCKHEAVEAIRKAYRLGYEIHLVTARGSFGKFGENIKRLTRSQVIREEIPNNGLHFAPDKTEVIRRLGLHYFLDDRPKHFAEATEAGAKAYLLDERWNQEFEVPYGRRVYSTAEFIDRIVRRHGDQTGRVNHLRPESYAR